MRVAVLLYAYAGGVPASRKIARTLHEDLAFRVLAANRAPDFRTIRDCRSPHLDALRDLFEPVLRLCQRAGLVTLGHLALKCTQLKAHASTHTMTRDERMGKEEARLQAEVAAVLRQAEEVDARDDVRYGTDRTGDELPVELAFREGHLRTIRAAGFPRGLSVADRIRRTLRTKRGRRLYAKRTSTVEPIFGQIKQGRGFRQFLLRGHHQVRGEWALICTTHNVLKRWTNTTRRRPGGLPLILWTPSVHNQRREVPHGPAATEFHAGV